MRIREFFVVPSSDSGFLWKHQMLLGVLLVLAAVTIALVPELLIMLTAAGIFIVGVALIGSAWEMRKLDLRRQETSNAERFEW